MMTEQLALIAHDSEEAMLLPDTERRKRYTAPQVTQIESKLNCIVAMLACGAIPITGIAERVRVSPRTVREIATRYVEQVGADALQFADYAARKSAKFLYLASAKTDEHADKTGAKDLMLMAKLASDIATNLRVSGQMASVTDERAALEMEGQTDEQLERFRRWLLTDSESPSAGNGEEQTTNHQNERKSKS